MLQKGENITPVSYFSETERSKGAIKIIASEAGMGWVNYIKGKRQNLTSESLSAILKEQIIIFTELKENKLTLRVVYTAVCSRSK